MRRTRGLTVKGDLDHLVEGRLVAGGAQRAIILLAGDCLERGGRVEHAAAAGAQHAPRQFEKAEAGSVQERSDGGLFIKTVPGGKIQHVEAAKLTIRRLANRAFDGGNGIGASRLPQHAEEGFDLAHV